MYNHLRKLSLQFDKEIVTIIIICIYTYQVKAMTLNVNLKRIELISLVFERHSCKHTHKSQEIGTRGFEW